MREEAVKMDHIVDVDVEQRVASGHSTLDDVDISRAEEAEHEAETQARDREKQRKKELQEERRDWINEQAVSGKETDAAAAAAENESAGKATDAANSKPTAEPFRSPLSDTWLDGADEAHMSQEAASLAVERKPGDQRNRDFRDEHGDGVIHAMLREHLP